LDAVLGLIKYAIAPEEARLLAVFLFFLIPFFFAYWAVKRGEKITLRPIQAYAALKDLLARAAEAGQPVHLSLGTGGIGDEATADTAAGLQVLEYLAERAVISANPPIVTIANPTALPVAQDLLRRAYTRQGYPDDYDGKRVRFVAPDPAVYSGQSPNPSIYASTPGGTPVSAGTTPIPNVYAITPNDAFAYAAGTMQLLNQHKLAANVMVGRFGDEFLLLAETGAQRNLVQIGGTSSTTVLPFVYTSVSHPLIGEEIYAGGAYLSDKPAHVSSLLAQDIMRWALVIGIAASILLKTAGLM
jgi:hypothetical protein